MASARRLRSSRHRGAEHIVAWIERQKYNLLAYAAVLAVVLPSATMIIFLTGNGERLTEGLADFGGYLAVVGVVLGLPALAYAMVTDSTAGRIENELGKTRRRELFARIDGQLGPFKDSLPDHVIQVFMPDHQLTLLLPVYDPTAEGPDEGWGIRRKTPQAFTGSAWVGRSYLSGSGKDLNQSKLRLTAAQLESYKELKAVAAAPIFGRGPGVDPIGVLTVFSKDPDNRIGTPEFREMHEEEAERLAPTIRDFAPESGPLDQRDLSAHM